VILRWIVDMEIVENFDAALEQFSGIYEELEVK